MPMPGFPIKVLRGGSWLAPETSLHTSQRFWNQPENNSYGSGIALLLTFLLRRRTMKPTITQPSNSQSVDRKMLLLLRRKGAQTIEGLNMLTGIGWGQVFLSVDRLSRTGKVLLTAVYPSEYRVSLGRAGSLRLSAPHIANSEHKT